MSNDPPWWSADDEQFSGATPLFENGEDDEAAEGNAPAAGDESADAGAEAAPADAGAEAAPDDAEADAGTTADAGSPADAGSAADAGSPAGTPIMEALRLAAAVAAWSNETGLTDTLRELAGEAAEQLTANPSDALPLADAPVVGTQHEATCDYCPLCRSVAILRVVQPQMAQGVAEAMAGLTEALEAAVEGFAASNRRS